MMNNMTEDEKLILQDLIIACCNNMIIGKDQAEDMLKSLNK